MTDLCEAFLEETCHRKSFGSSIRIFMKDMNFVGQISCFNLRGMDEILTADLFGRSCQATFTLIR